ncbi:hypothetical protein FB562_2461 [Homoserinimonas aerilata]|uniref:Lipoprotein LpqB N-terminal domain-containing protein n=1 Tax=Homoserinimonas aerilata TaxID=1162970 RepID=A0A542YAC7_9MICO|nr:hypothetical protein [Homoserinimonas aerilata]TQL45049.1 hypothetical protein FB562_2461 [Homoserinimonas aerilata]
MSTATGRPDRTLVVIVSIIAAVVILALVVVFTRGTPTPLDPATPEGAVQKYASAVVDGDFPAATQLMTRAVREQCERADGTSMGDIRLTLNSSKVSADTAVVRVTISRGVGGGLFGPSLYDSEGTFSLLNEDGAWMIDSAPWELAVCYNQGQPNE